MEPDAKEMVQVIEEAITDDEFELTEWEAEFVENIKNRIANDIDLTPKQEESLEKIWKRSRGE